MKNRNRQNQKESENSEQVAKSNPAKKKRVRKIIIYSASGLAFLFLVVFPILINIYADRIIGRALSEIVRIESNGAYTLSFSEVGLNVFSRDISFDSVLLIPDTSFRYPDSIPEKYAMSLMVPKIHLKGATWLRAIFLKELVIEDFLIEKPGVEMFFNPVKNDSLPFAAANDSSNFNPQNLPDLLERYLDQLEVKHFHFNRGSIAVMHNGDSGRDTLEAMNLSVVVENFSLDSAAYLNPDKLFFADSIGLRFDDGYFSYRTQTDAISFRQLDVSSDRGTMLLKDFTLRRDSSLVSADSVSMFSVHIDEVKLSGVNYRDYMASNALRLERIDITRPQIIFTPKQSDTGANLSREQMAKGIYNEVSSYFSAVKIDSLNLIHGSMKLPGIPVSGIRDFSIADFNLSLQHVLIDSLSFQERSKYFFVDDLNFESFNQAYSFDSLDLNISYDKIFLSTSGNTLNFSNLIVDKKGGKQKNSFSVKIPQLNILAKDMKQDFVNHALSFKMIEMQDAEAEILAIRQKAKSKSIDIYHLYPQIENLLKWVDIDHFKLSQANVDYTLRERKTDKIRVSAMMDLDILDFSLNAGSAEKRQVFYNDEMHADIRNLNIQVPANNQHFFAGALNFNTKTADVEVRDLHIDTLRSISAKEKNQMLLTMINAAGVDLKGVDFRRLYLSKGYFIDTIRIEEPDIFIIDNKLDTEIVPTENQRRKVNFMFGYTEITDGRYTYAEKGNSYPELTIENFNISVGALKPVNNPTDQMAEAGEVKGTLKEIYYKIPDNIHQLKIEQFDFSSADSTLDLKNLSFGKSFDIPENLGGVVDLSLPGISVEAIPVFDLYHDHALKAGLLRFDQPVLVYHQSGVQQKNATFLDFNPDIIRDQILKSLALIAVDSVEIDDGRFILTDGNNHETEKMKVDGVHLLVNGFKVDSLTSMKEENILFAAGIHLDIDSITDVLSQQNETVYAAKIEISTANKSATVGDVALDIYQNKDAAEKSHMTIGEISLVGIDYFKLLAYKNLDFKKLEITSPDLTFTRFDLPADHDASNDLNLNAYDLIAQQLHRIKADELFIHKTKLKIKDAKSRDKRAYLFEQIDFQIRQLLIDSVNRIFDNKFLYSDDLSFTIHHYQENTSDSLYAFGAEKIKFSSSSATLLVDSGFLKPNYPDTVFAAKVGYQTDCLDLVFDSLKFSNIRLLKFIRDNTLWVDKVLLEGLQGSDYRSKRYPLPVNHYPQLPASALQNLGFTLMIDSLHISNSGFTYREYMPPALEPGKIWFSDIDITGRNITNSRDKIALDSLMRFSVTSQLMGKGELFLNLSFNIEKQNDHFTANGLLNHFDITELNPMLENVAFVKVTKGYNDMLSFNFSANHSLATGDMQFEYNKLHIRLIDKKTLRMEGFGESIASFIANTFVVRRNNPKFPFGIRNGDIYFRRDTTRSFFNYLAKSTLSGVKKTIRGGNEERKEKRQKREMERQLKSEGRLNDKMMRELNREKRRED